MDFYTSLHSMINILNSHELAAKVLKFATKNYLFCESDFLSLNNNLILQLLASKLEGNSGQTKSSCSA